jgi:tRNA/tmRNA/rRNA uracil-C5-methylase (TrmA/RlmC/RlmD family)
MPTGGVPFRQIQSARSLNWASPLICAVYLCCGDGLFTLAIARQAAHVVAIDLDPVMLDRARARLSGAGVGNCEIVEGDAYDVAN